jgi:hypothetical protein
LAGASRPPAGLSRISPGGRRWSTTAPYPSGRPGSIARWWWPTAAVSGFLAVIAYTLGHDDPAPGLSHRGLLTVALAALVMVLLTIHRRYGSGSLARALLEYTVVSLLATLLASAAGGEEQPADRPTRGQVQAAAGDDQPVVIRAGAKVVRAITGAAAWLVDLWRQADPKNPPTTSEAMAAPPRSSAPSVLLLRRCL